MIPGDFFGPHLLDLCHLSPVASPEGVDQFGLRTGLGNRMGKSCDFFGKEDDTIGKMVGKPLGPGAPIINIHRI